MKYETALRTKMNLGSKGELTKREQSRLATAMDVLYAAYVSATEISLGVETR